MAWLRWLAVGLAGLEAGFMTFDGIRALVTGDYITPKGGEYSGQLGPWTRVVELVGIAPRSTLMKAIFIVYGLLWLAIILAFALKASWAWTTMLVLAVGSLWYLTFGTVVSALVIALLFVQGVRDVYR